MRESVRAICRAVSASVALSLCAADGQNARIQHHHSSAPENVHKFVLSGWTQDETMFSKTIFLRAQKLEEKTSFRFDKDWVPKVRLEWSLGTSTSGSNGIYKAETRTTYFPIRIFYELSARHKNSSDS